MSREGDRSLCRLALREMLIRTRAVPSGVHQRTDRGWFHDGGPGPAEPSRGDTRAPRDNRASDGRQNEFDSRRSMLKKPARPLIRAVNPEFRSRHQKGGASPEETCCHAAAISRFPRVLGHSFRGLHTSNPVGNEPGHLDTVSRPCFGIFLFTGSCSSESIAEYCAVHAAAAREVFSAQPRQTNQLWDRMRKPLWTEL